MPNPIDDAPVGPGEIALPLDTQSRANEAARLRRFRLRAFYFVVICFTITLVAFFEHPPAIERPIEELERTEPLTDIALDPRLQAYETPESADHCAEWVLEPDVENLAFASFELPTAADLLFFLSRGPVSGHISIVENPVYSSGPIEVNVTAQYHHDEDLERTKVCRMGAANEHGLLLWAEPQHPHGDPRHGVRFNVTVALPNGVRNYKDLSTDLALFSHSAGGFFHLWFATSFDAIRLRSANAAIDFGSLVGKSAFIQTTNAKVEGFFGGPELVAQTSNAPMDVIAFMFGESPGSESRVNLTTSNGAISAHLGLASDFTNNTLRSVVRTTAASITINTPRQSMMVPNASFLLDAATTVGPVTLNMYPEFEGTYDLQTTGWRTKASVEEVSENVDPEGKGRQRTVTRESTGRHARGKIYWSKDGKPTEGVERGDVRIATTVSPVKVNL